MVETQVNIVLLRSQFPLYNKFIILYLIFIFVKEQNDLKKEEIRKIQKIKKKCEKYVKKMVIG